MRVGVVVKDLNWQWQGRKFDRSSPTRLAHVVSAIARAVAVSISAHQDHRGGHELSPVSCPRRGVHHTSPTDGCIHRLTVGCHSDQIIDIAHSCSAPGQRGQLAHNDTKTYVQCGNCRGWGGWTPPPVNAYRRSFLVKIGFKFQSPGKISNISKSDPRFF